MECDDIILYKVYGFDHIYSGMQMLDETRILSASGTILQIHDCCDDRGTTKAAESAGFVHIESCQKVTAFKTSKSAKLTAIAGIKMDNDYLVANLNKKETIPFIAILNSYLHEINRFPNQSIYGLILAIEFSPEENEIITLQVVAKSQAVLRLWDIHSGLCLAHSEPTLCEKPRNTPFLVSQVSFCPGDSSLMIWTDGNSMRFMRHLGDRIDVFTNLLLLDDKMIICHAWLDDTTIICGSNEGKLMVYHEKDLLDEISIDSLTISHLDQDLHLIPKTISVSTRFLIVGTQFGVVILWPLDSSQVQWNLLRILSLPLATSETQMHPITCISLNTAETCLGVCSTNNIWRVPITKLPDLPLLCDGFDDVMVSSTSTITSFSCCPLMDRIVTGDSAGYVHVRDVGSRFHVMSQKYAGSIISVSIHPLGFHLLIALASHISFGLISNHGIQNLTSLAFEKLKQVLNAKWNNEGSKIAIITRESIEALGCLTQSVEWLWPNRVLDVIDLIFHGETVVVLLSDKRVIQLKHGQVINAVQLGNDAATSLCKFRDSLLVAFSKGVCMSYSLEVEEEGAGLKPLKPMQLMPTETFVMMCTNESDLITISASDKVMVWVDKSGDKDELSLHCTRNLVTVSLAEAQQMKRDLLVAHAHLEETKSTSEILMNAEKNQFEKEKIGLEISHQQQITGAQNKITELESQLESLSLDHQSTVKQLKTLYEQETKQKEEDFKERFDQYSAQAEQDALDWLKERNQIMLQFSEEKESLLITAAKVEDEFKSKYHKLENENFLMQEKMYHMEEICFEYETWKKLNLNAKMLELGHRYKEEMSKVKELEDKVCDLLDQRKRAKEHQKELLSEKEKLQLLTEEERRENQNSLRRKMITIKEDKEYFEREVQRLEAIVEGQKKEIAAARREMKQEIIRRQHQERQAAALLEAKLIESKVESPVDHNVQSTLTRRIINERTITFPPLIKE